MIIDFHTHTFPDAIAEKTITLLKSKSKTEPFCNGTNADLAQKARSSGVNLSVVLPVITNPASVEKINSFAAKVNEKTAETGIFSFGGMHPDAENYKGLLKQVKELGLKGIKIHPAYQHTQIDDIKFERIIGYAEELGLIVLSHGGLDIGVDGDWCSPKKTAKLLKEVHPTRLVMAHMGGWEQWDEVKDCLLGENVYLDTSFCCVDFSYQKTVKKEEARPVLLPEKFLDMIKSHGTDKILFGTDSPWGDQKTQIDFIHGLELSNEQKKAIFYDNAAKLLNL